jgi:DNA-binding MarR family transcriptional regulator
VKNEPAAAEVTDAPVREAWLAMQDLLLLGEAQAWLHDAAAAHDLTPSAIKALFRLEHGGAIAMRDLAEQFRCDASYITGLVDGLEDRGLAVRQAHPTDRRVKTVVLTDRGREVTADLRVRRSVPPPAFAVLSADEQRTLRDLLRRVTAADASLSARAHLASTG